MRTTDAQPRQRRSLISVLLAVAVLLSGVGLSYACFVAVSHNELRHAGQVMDRYADQIRVAVADRVARYSETLTDLAWAIGAEGSLTSATFDHMTSGLNATRLTGASAVSFVVAASTDQVPATQAQWRKNGEPSLKLATDSSVSEHAFVIFETVFDDSLDMRGVDVAQNPEAASALTTARQSGALAISPPAQLARDAGVPQLQRQASVLLAAPVYARQGSTFAPKVFQGWITMGVRGDDFLDQTLQTISEGASQVSLSDSGTVIAAVHQGTEFPEMRLRRNLSLTAGQRSWNLTLVPATGLVSPTDRGMGRWVLGVGLALSLMLVALTAVLAGSRNHALTRVDRATAALREDVAARCLVEAQLRDREKELHHMAFHDPLTGLANRLLFYERVRHAVKTHARDDRTFAVLFIDLDGFKRINDEFGHDAGDAVLRMTASRLLTLLREGDTVARFGGDEFAVLVERLHDSTGARITAERVVAQLRKPIAIGKLQVGVTASVGITMERGGADVSDLIRDADAAMYAAKASGKSRYVESGALVSGQPAAATEIPA